MFQSIKRMLAVVGLVAGCMVAANAHEACEEQKAKAAVGVQEVHTHAEVDRSQVKTKSRVKSHVPEVVLVLPQDDRESKLSSGDGCLRAACNCSSSTHNNPYCRPTGGDCANHPGILCIW